MIRFSLRLSEELHERIKRLSEREKRSLNNQMIAMLEAETKRAERKNAE